MSFYRFRSPHPQSSGEPIVNLPPMVATLIGISVAAYLLLAIVPWRWEAAAIVTLGFIPARYTVGPVLDWPALAGPVTYMFIHGGALHLIVNMVMLAAFGSAVERNLGKWSMLGLYLVCGVVGAFAHLTVYPVSTVPVVGASGAISGMFGAVLRILAHRTGSALGATKLLPVAAIWIGFAILTGLTGAPGAAGEAVAWVAHIGGFLSGLLLFGLFDRSRPSGAA